MKSLVARTIDLLQDRGYRAECVEQYNSFSRRRRDLFGVFDVLAVGNGETLAVQVTSASNVSKRVHKIEDSDALADVRAAGWSISVHGWRKVKGYYRVREVDLS